MPTAKKYIRGDALRRMLEYIAWALSSASLAGGTIEMRMFDTMWLCGVRMDLRATLNTEWV